MKNMTKREYCFTGGNCPVCRSDDVDYIENTTNFLEQGRVCITCKAVWEEHYKISHYKLITDKDSSFHSNLQEYQRKEIYE
jgi:hypothetical protein